ncbi:MAG TPA: 2-oxoacid:acceptor oxidoreductase family protein [bacterium]|nr:2-oxoacid:acceptor oxidoreductase family protein [bacterium]
MYYDVLMAGFGGQGILMIGDLLALTAMREDKHVTWMPSYGVEMRGGTANCTVVISDRRIGSPITGRPYSLIAMNKPSLEKFAPIVRPGGLIIGNATFMAASDLSRKDVDAVFIPTLDLANEIGDQRMASMIALGAFIDKTGVVTLENAVSALESTLPEKRKHLLPLNRKALECGRDFARNGK